MSKRKHHSEDDARLSNKKPTPWKEVGKEEVGDEELTQAILEVCRKRGAGKSC